jgi:uncharacterized protein YjdB
LTTEDPIMKSRLISVILVLIMVTSLTPAAALAADVTPEPVPTETTEPVSSEAPEPTPGPTTDQETPTTPEPEQEATVSPEPETEPEETPEPSGEADTQAEAVFTLNEADTDYTYTINSDGVSVTITGYSGSGGNITIPGSLGGLPVTAFKSGVFKNNTTLTGVIIPQGVTSIPDEAFYGCRNLASAALPQGITYIGRDAFNICQKLTGIELPDSVQKIGNYAFYLCTLLDEIDLPDSLSECGNWAFAGCPIQTVSIPVKLTAIPDYMFMGCYKLAEVNLPDSLMEIGDYAFMQCTALEAISIPNSVTKIGSGAFMYCDLLSAVSLPEELKLIDDFAFSQCPMLRSIDIPDGVESINQHAFAQSGLTKAVIPDSVTKLENGVFFLCKDMVSTALPSTMTSIPYNFFYGCEKLMDIDLPASVTEIEYSAFSGCASLTDITIPDSVGTIDNTAFKNCSQLESVYFEGNVPSSFGTSVFTGTADGCTIYYLAGSTGFTNPWQGYPTAVYEAGEETVNVTGVTLNIHSKTITEGNSFALSATVLPENATDPDVTWASSDETVAVVDANGLVTGIGPGRTTITAAAGSQEDSCEVTVAPVSTTNYLSGCYIRFDDGTADGVTGNCYGTPCAIIPSSVINLQMPNRFGYCVLEPITTDEDNLYEITYGAETVSNNLPYFVFMPNPGTKTYTVVVHPAEGEQRSYTVNITRTSQNIDVESVTLDSQEENLTEGETVALNAQVLPVDATDPGVTWTSSDETVATVDENGLVTAISAGTARITAAAGEASDYCDVTVEPLSTTNYLRSCYVYCEGMTIDGVDGEFNSENGSIITNPVINLLVPNSVTECMLEPMTTDEDNLYDIIDGDETVSVNEPYAVQMPQAGVRTLTVLIRPAEGEQRTYTVNITRAVAEGKASAYSIQWSSDYDTGSVLDYINVPFEAGRYVYDLTVPYALEQAQLSAYPSDAGTVCRVYRNGDQVATVGTATVDFAVGRNVVEVVFTDGAGVKKTYTYTVYRRGLDSLLDIQYLNMASVLSTNRTDEYQPMWLEDFNGESLSYSLNLPNAADRIVFDPILASEDATVDVKKGSSVVNDSGGGYVSGLEAGSNVFTFTVSHPSVGYTKTYTVTVMRAAQDDANAELCNLLIGSQQVDGFDGDEMEYDVTSQWGEEMSPVTADANATYEIYEDGELAAVNEPAECPVWPAVMTVVVTAGDGVTARTYTLNVNDESDAELAELSLYDTHDNTGYQSDFDLQDGVYAYAADTVFANSAPILNISMKSDEQSVAVYQGRKLLARGTDSHLATGLNLDTGLNTYTIVVTAADGETQHAYTISITRAAKPADNNANIARASLWLGTEWIYTEFLSSAETDYQFSVGRSAGQAGFSATLESASATCRAYLNGVLLADSNRCMLEFLPVSEGSNTLRLVVTAEDGVTTKTYNISINREVSDLNQLELISAPVKTEYKVGESLNLTGLSVTAHYASGYRKVLDGGDVQTSGYDSRTAGTQTVTVTYQGKSTMFDVIVNAVRVTGVTLSSTAETLYVGATISLKATVAPDDASYPAVTWTSSNNAVATVDTSGKVKAVGEGSATITAAADGMSDTCLVQVQRKRVESVSLNSSYSDMPIGTTLALVATVNPADATDRTVTWTSSNTAVATVNQNGLVTGVGDGKASITARADGKSAVCTVQVHATYRINPSSSSDGSTTGGGVYAYNSVVTIQAYPKADYYFKYWTENDVVISTEPVLAVAVTSNRSIHAIFERIGKPSIHTLRAASNTSLYVAWTDVSGATSYEVWRSVTPARDYTLIGTTGSTNYTDTGLQTNVIYYYRVKAVCAGATATTFGDFSYAASARTVPAAPAVGVSPAGYNTAWVTWNAVAGATKYEVWRSTNSVGGYKKISTVSASKLYYKNTGLSPGTVYYYQVRAYQKIGRTIVYGEFSSPVSVQTTLGAVTGARAARSKAGTIKLSWSAVSGRSKYEVWRSTSPNGGFALVTTTGSTSFTNKGLAQGVTYYYQIRAYRLIGKIKAYGGYSAVVSAIA